MFILFLWQAGLSHSLGVRMIGLHCKQTKRMSRKAEKRVILRVLIPEKRAICVLIFLKKCVRLIQIKYSRVVIDLKRNAISDLIQWKNNPKRKPLVIRGARQVGKTWLMQEFGQTCYEDFVYLNFDEEDELKSIFETNKNPQRIIELLSLQSGKKILPEKTLILFDEIQECPEALNTLKYFKEKASEYHVIAAGSLLGTLLAQPKSYPVGMVNLLDLYPLTFDEFLEATEPSLYAYYESIHKGQQIEEIFHNRLLESYSYYLIIGGMPECVSSWVSERDPAQVAQIQKELIEIYENDFSKHNGKVNSGRILMVFRSIVSQLAKSNEKFIYGAVRQGGRARDFEEAIEWLVSAGMLNRVYNVSKMEHPLSAFDKLDQFKLFLFDTGLLKHMAGIDNSAILLKADYQFKGPLTENYVLQQLRGHFAVEPRYFADKNREIDFVLQNGMEIIPVEAKGGENKSAPSFKRYIVEFHPEHAIRFSKRGYRKDGDITNIPLYLVRKTKELL